MIHGHGDDLFRYKDIRINFSSNIYTHFDHTALFQHLSQVLPRVTSYPEPSPDSLEEALARHHGIRPEEVMVTNGATEAIYLIARAYADHRMHIPQPTFSEYADACAGTSGEGDDMYWICNPNNPTGTVLPPSELPEGKLVLDASYAAYTDKKQLSASEAVARGNVLMLRSMTKDYAIPGIRLGYVIGAEQMLRPLKALRMPWSIGTIALEAGKYLLQHKADYVVPIHQLLSERERLATALQQMGIHTYPSHSNILLARLSSGTASALKEQLATRYGILIRDASNFSGLTPQHFRLAVQSASENDTLVACLEKCLHS